MTTSVGRLTTPRSHAGRVEDSDEEGTEYANEDDDTFNYGNEDVADNAINVRVSLILAHYSYALCQWMGK